MVWDLIRQDQLDHSTSTWNVRCVESGNVMLGCSVIEDKAKQYAANYNQRCKSMAGGRRLTFVAFDLKRHPTASEIFNK